MQGRSGHITLETIAAESAKFTAPLLCVHGLWCTAGVWRRFMGYCAHRGWTCHALNLRGRAAAGVPTDVAEVRFADYLDDVRRAIAACEAPPVVMGHDLGGLLAVCSGATARAVVALAPLVPAALVPPSQQMRIGWGVRLAMLRARPLPVPRGALATRYFAGGPPGGTTVDSSTVARELTRRDFPLLPRCAVPALMIAGGRDEVCRRAAVEQLAGRVGAEFQLAGEASHALPWEPGWEHCVGTVHRWLVQTLGEPLLAMRDDEEE